MKRWTVMLIPHDRGNTRNLDMAAYQLWLVVAIIVVLSFTTTFFFKRHQVLAAQARHLEQVARQLELERSAPAPIVQAGISDRERGQFEQRIQNYEASMAAITAELNELYEVETQARELNALPPRSQPDVRGGKEIAGGKGGGPSQLEDVAYADTDMMARPPTLIYGESRPSADSIIQEINLRKESIRGLLLAFRAEQDQNERVPSMWPVATRAYQVTSRYGYRVDPFSHRIRHHDGIDISARYGTPVVATAKGKVLHAGRDPYLGNVVKIDHGSGRETWYAHLKACLVKPGQVVSRKQVIGTLGNTGRTTGAHLHYEVHVNGKPADSGKYLAGD